LKLVLKPSGIQLPANEDQLGPGRLVPGGAVEADPFAAELEDVSLLAISKPDDALASIDLLGEFVVKKFLETAKGEGAIALEGNGHEAIFAQVV
jgi:hypothetical protein